PAGLINDDAFADRFGVSHEFRQARHTPKTRDVKPVNQIAGILKLNRQEKRGADVDALYFDALRVATAHIDFIRPEIQTRVIGLSTKEVLIMRRNKVVCVINIAL